jgi:3',5'-cyclic AMP phosphodiesterase CpdA
LPELSTMHPAGPFPVVKLRGPVAFIGLATALPRPPLVAAGALGAPQLDALNAVLAHPAVAGRTPVVLQHHPPDNPPSRLKTMLEGLHDADELQRALAPVTRGLVLHGHLHRRLRRTLTTHAGSIDVIGATSASLVHDDRRRMAGYNIYEIGPDGSVENLSCGIFDPHTKRFSTEAL